MAHGADIETEIVSSRARPTYHVIESVSIPQIGANSFNAIRIGYRSIPGTGDGGGSEEQAYVRGSSLVSGHCWTSSLMRRMYGQAASA